MRKVAVVFWSGTGNTRAMADQVVAGAQEGGAQVSLLTAAQFQPSMLDELDAVAFGCPSMGEEVLEEEEFEPMFSACEDRLKDKTVGLFGSYGWGDGEWMRNWEARCKKQGARLVGEGVICTDYPEEPALSACRQLGSSLLQ